MKKLFIIIITIMVVSIVQAQTWYNNGATLHINEGAILHVNGAWTNTPGSDVQNKGTITTTGTVSGSTYTAPILFQLNGVYDNPTNSNHINGYVSKLGNTSFIFPTGNGTLLRRLAISAPTSITDQYTTAWLEGNPTTTQDPSDNEVHSITSLGNGILSVSDIGQWDWIAASGNGNGLTITAYIPDMASYVNSPSSLRLVGWNGNQWVNLSGTNGASALLEGSMLSGTMQPSISAIGVGATTLALPVVFGQINAAIKNNTLQISFTSLTETNNDHFLVLASTDGKTFKEIGVAASTAPNGNSSEPIDYSFKIDARNISFAGMLLGSLLTVFSFSFTRKKKWFFSGILLLTMFTGLLSCSKSSKDLMNTNTNSTLFIRIAQVDIDGTKAYSKIIKATRE